ncbi:hypothetical protein ACIGMX_03605 [Streptomyces aquilus]|uniref:hypothetical protein n=1 Tax=Streptomyces aquilus TaxID=2548456 RepID=UPI0037D88800
MPSQASRPTIHIPGTTSHTIRPRAVKDRDAVVLAISFGVAGQLADLFASVPAETVVIEVSVPGRCQWALRSCATWTKSWNVSMRGTGYWGR